MGRSSLVRLVALLLLLAAAICSVVFFAELRQWLADVLEEIETLGFWGPVWLVLIYIVGTVLCFPGSVLTLGAGAIFGFVRGYVAVTIGSVLGAYAAFFVGRTVARGWVDSKLAGNPRLRAIDQAVGTQAFKIVLLTRLSPVFPFTLLNYAVGLTRVSFRHYALASFLGMIPGTVLYVSLGAGIGSLARVAAGDFQGGFEQQILFLGGLAVTVVVAVYVAIVARKALEHALPGLGEPHQECVPTRVHPPLAPKRQ
jgi:uncharacterized membrane protein YdjX (TVP38/TMEM64 family)